MKKKFIIVGGGTAGLNAYRSLIQEYDKQDILLIGDNWKTTCADVGCMPSKAFIAEAKRSHDFVSSLRYAQRERDRFVSYVLEGRHDIPKITGRATSPAPGIIHIDEQIYGYEKLIVATGSYVRPIPMSLIGQEQQWKSYFWNNETFFNDQNSFKGEKILVIGTGVIGLELGNALSETHKDVTYVSMNNNCGILEDDDLKKEHQKTLNAFFDVTSIHTIMESQGQLLIEFVTNGIAYRHYYDKILWTAGRMPHTDWIQWDYRNNNDVILIGDVNNQRPLLHEAEHQGKNIMDIIQGTYQPDIPFGIVFSHLQQAKLGYKNQVSYYKKRNFINQGRMRLEETNQGGVILGFDANNMLVYAEILHKNAEHLAHFLMISIVQRLTYEQLKNLPYYHPTIYESIKNML